MKTVEFQTRLSGRTLRIPSDVAQQIPSGQSVKVILLIPDSDEDQEWVRLTAKQFLKGYAASDAIYDKLSAG